MSKGDEKGLEKEGVCFLVSLVHLFWSTCWTSLMSLGTKVAIFIFWYRMLLSVFLVFSQCIQVRLVRYLLHSRRTPSEAQEVVQGEACGNISQLTW